MPNLKNAGLVGHFGGWFLGGEEAFQKSVLTNFGEDPEEWKGGEMEQVGVEWSEIIQGVQETSFSQEQRNILNEIANLDMTWGQRKLGTSALSWWFPIFKRLFHFWEVPPRKWTSTRPKNRQCQNFRQTGPTTVQFQILYRWRNGSLFIVDVAYVVLVVNSLKWKTCSGPLMPSPLLGPCRHEFTHLHDPTFDSHRISNGQGLTTTP